MGGGRAQYQFVCRGPQTSVACATPTRRVGAGRRRWCGLQEIKAACEWLLGCGVRRASLGVRCVCLAGWLAGCTAGWLAQLQADTSAAAMSPSARAAASAAATRSRNSAAISSAFSYTSAAQGGGAGGRGVMVGEGRGRGGAGERTQGAGSSRYGYDILLRGRERAQYNISRCPFLPRSQTATQPSTLGKASQTPQPASQPARHADVVHPLQQPAGLAASHHRHWS